jgi:hypothetical protein
MGSFIQKIAMIITEDPNIFVEDLGLIIEAQIDYLSKKYGGQADLARQDSIEHAVNVARQYGDLGVSEKLLYGYVNGVIDEISLDNVEQVKDLDPFKKETRKSETDVAYEETVQKAKQINRRYWQWIVRVWKDEPTAQFDESWFDYLQYSDIPDEELLKKSTAEISALSDTWHEEEFANQDVGGEYTKGIEDEDAEQIDGNWWIVPIHKEDAKIEGAKMQNCIGNLCNPSETRHLFSLRDKFNNPKVSIEVAQNRPYHAERVISTVNQVKGKQNKSPSQKYVLPVIKWLLDHPEHYDGGGTRDFWNIMPADEKLVNTIVLKMAKNVKLDAMNLNYSIANYFSGQWDNQSEHKVMDFITEDTADFILSHSEIIPTHGEIRVSSTLEGILSKASPDMLGTLLAMDFNEADQPGITHVTETDTTKFVQAILTTGKVSKENLQSVLQDQNSSLTTKAIIHAQYYPDKLEEFMDNQAPTKEVLENFKKYESIFFAMPDGSSPYAAKLLLAFDERQDTEKHGRTSGAVRTLLEKTPDNLLGNVMRHHASLQHNNLFSDLHDIIPILDRSMDEQGYMDAVKIIYSPFSEARGHRNEKSLPTGHNGGGVARTVKRILNQFSDDALKELAQNPELHQMARDVLYAKHGVDDSTEGSTYYSTDIDELKAAAKATRSRKKRQQIENKIKRIRRRRRKAAQVEKEKSLEQKLDTI